MGDFDSTGQKFAKKSGVMIPYKTIQFDVNLKAVKRPVGIEAIIRSQKVW